MDSSPRFIVQVRYGRRWHIFVVGASSASDMLDDIFKQARKNCAAASHMAPHVATVQALLRRVRKLEYAPGAS